MKNEKPLCYTEVAYYRRIIRAMAATALCEARAKVQAMTEKQVADETAWIAIIPGMDLRQALAIHIAKRYVSNHIPSIIVRHIVEDHPKIDDDVMRMILDGIACRYPGDSAELGDLIDDLCYFCRCHWGSNYRRAHYVVDTDTGITKTFFY